MAIDAIKLPNWLNLFQIFKSPRNYCATLLFDIFLCINVSKNSKYYFFKSQGFKVSKTVFGFEIDWVHAKLWAIKDKNENSIAHKLQKYQLF